MIGCLWRNCGAVGDRQEGQKDMHKASKVAVECAVRVTDGFKVGMGLHQRSALSTFLFAMLMDGGRVGRIPGVRWSLEIKLEVR